ncbi:UNVERIFIED_ORG: hypothetical protein J2791_004369 [Burkholderia contaminans]|nr:hypothetical protein [Burkholderia contaminans]
MSAPISAPSARHFICMSCTRFPHVSSSTATRTGPASIGASVKRTPSASSRAMMARLEHQLGAVGLVLRHDRQPAVLAHRHVVLQPEAEDVGVKRECLVLIVDKDARHVDTHDTLS